ncbi:MAG: hypothetical protein JRD93_11685 [Deltaproteobacteria bacterium]|jgi:hypothetical protein|nr:hypothetical protein [Deltaproteobacteria bacterium]
MNIQNIDMICAKYGSKIARIDKLSEPLVNKSLGVLQEDGVYSFFLFLAAQAKGKQNTPADCIQKDIFDLLKVFFQSIKNSQEDILGIIRNNLAEDLDDLLLSKDIIERTMVYARYHLKAKPKED